MGFKDKTYGLIFLKLFFNCKLSYNYKKNFPRALCLFFIMQVTQLNSNYSSLYM